MWLHFFLGNPGKWLAIQPSIGRSSLPSRLQTASRLGTRQSSSRSASGWWRQGPGRSRHCVIRLPKMATLRWLVSCKIARRQEFLRILRFKIAAPLDDFLKRWNVKDAGHGSSRSEENFFEITKSFEQNVLLNHLLYI